MEFDDQDARDRFESRWEARRGEWAGVRDMPWGSSPPRWAEPETAPAVADAEAGAQEWSQSASNDEDESSEGEVTHYLPRPAGLGLDLPTAGPPVTESRPPVPLAIGGLRASGDLDEAAAEATRCGRWPSAGWRLYARGEAQSI